MANYGFRVFAIELHEGNKRRSAAFEKCGEEHFSNTAERLLKSLSLSAKFGMPNDFPDESAEDASTLGFQSKPMFRVEEVEKRSHTIRGEVLSGIVGNYDKAVGASNELDISEMAASRNFHFVFAFPEKGSKAILAVEDISRSCPVTPLVRWLKWASQQEAKPNSEETTEGIWWKLTVKAIADEHHLREMIKNGRVDKIEVIKNSITSARTRHSEKYRISGPLPGNKRGQLMQLINSWIEKENSEENGPLDPSENAKHMASIIGPELEALDLDDGWVVLKDQAGRTKKINPTRISEIFTYPQPTENRIDSAGFYTEVRRVALRLQAAERMNIPWPER